MDPAYIFGMPCAHDSHGVGNVFLFSSRRRDNIFFYFYAILLSVQKKSSVAIFNVAFGTDKRNWKSGHIWICGRCLPELYDFTKAKTEFPEIIYRILKRAPCNMQYDRGNFHRIIFWNLFKNRGRNLEYSRKRREWIFNNSPDTGFFCF